MLKSTVLKIIQTFSKEEIDSFEDFLKSPYHNKKTGIVKLYREVIKYAPDFTDKNLDKETLWVKIYPDKDYNYGVMKNLIHDFTKLAEQFITQQEYATRELQEFENLYSALSKRKLKNIIDNKEAYLNKKFDDATKDTTTTIDEFYGRLTKIYEIKMWNSVLHDQQQNLENDIVKMKDIFVTGMIVHLINVHYLAKVCSFNDKGKTNITHMIETILNSLPDKEIENALEILKVRSEIKYKLLKSYYLAYKATVNTDNSEYYFRFKSFLYNNYDGMPYPYLKDMDVYLVDGLSAMTDTTVDKKREYYEMHQFRHKNNLVVDRNNQLSSLHYIPWMFLFLDENKPTELEQYISHYQGYLIDDDKEASIMFAEAMIFFMNSEFEKALKLISKIKFNASMLKNILKKFTLMVHYETGDYEGFILAYDSYKHFLNYGGWGKREWIEHYIKKTKIFAGLIEKLFKQRESMNVTGIGLLEKEIHSLNIDNKKWFIRKVEELKKSA